MRNAITYGVVVLGSFFFVGYVASLKEGQWKENLLLLIIFVLAATLAFFIVFSKRTDVEYEDSVVISEAILKEAVSHLKMAQEDLYVESTEKVISEIEEHLNRQDEKK